MSCLPELFLPSRSQPLRPSSKIGGPFSLHLRSPLQPVVSSPRNPLPSSRYHRSWMDGDSSFTFTKRSATKSYYHKPPSSQLVLQQRGHSCGDVNNAVSRQSQMEEASSFNKVKRQALEQLQMMGKAVEGSAEEERRVREELAGLRQRTMWELEEFSQGFKGALLGVLRSFREGKREFHLEKKTIGVQVGQLEEDYRMCREIGEQLEGRLGEIALQFV